MVVEKYSQSIAVPVSFVKLFLEVDWSIMSSKKGILESWENVDWIFFPYHDSSYKNSIN